MNQDSANLNTADAKLVCIGRLKENGICVVTDVKDFEKKLLTGHYYVFFANVAATDEAFLEMSQTFEQLCQKNCGKCILYDLSAHPWEGISSNALMYYANGICIEDDVVRLFKLLRDYNVMKYTTVPKFSAKLPEDRAHAEMRCPKNCGKVKRKWICYYCLKMVNYGFNDCFYCGCGESHVHAMQWWCQGSVHGMGFGTFQESCLVRELGEIQHCKEYNVLLMGETGSGKSTWINSIANYIMWDGLDTALERPLICPIPTTFSVQTIKGEVRMIRVGENDDEIFEIGHSSTQKPKSYCFMYNNTRIRLIDVPGMYDTRGPEQDKKMFDLILQKLHTIKELHAICIFVNPDPSRLTMVLHYCISELLTHLHKSAVDNIKFFFTKVRPEVYWAGGALPALQKYLEFFEKNCRVKIKMALETVYYFDNTAFRLLCIAKEGVAFTSNEKDAYKESWNFSAHETFRFLKNLVTLEPHRTREMVSLNEATRIIATLRGPLAKIADNIYLNIRLVKEAKKECEELDLSAFELESRLHVSGVKIVAVPVNHPKTVCAKCSQVRFLPETNVKTIHYKQICHEPCYLESTVRRALDERLRHCEAMGVNHETCRICGCEWYVHHHVNYLQEQHEITVVDRITESLLKEKESRMIGKHNVLMAYDRQIAVLEMRMRKIIEICANFETFVQCTSIYPLRDAFIENFCWAIAVANKSADVCDDNDKETYLKRAENLKKIAEEYAEEVKFVRANLHDGQKTITCDDIVRMKQELCSMTSDDCDIASYLKTAEDASDRHVKQEDLYFEADEHVLNGTPFIQIAIRPHEKNRKADL